LAPDESITFTVTVTAIEAGEDVENVAIVSGDNFEDEEDEASVDIEEAPTLPQPTVTITKTANPTSVSAGGNVVYTLVVTNTGDVPLTSLIVTDNLPTQLTNPRNLVLPTGATGRFTNNELQVTLASLEPGARVTITFTATVVAGTSPNTPIVNTATVTDENTEATDSDRATVTIAPPPDREPTLPPDRDPTVPPGRDPTVPPATPTPRPSPQTSDEFSFNGLIASGLGLLLSLLTIFTLLFARASPRKLVAQRRAPVKCMGTNEHYKHTKLLTRGPPGKMVVEKSTLENYVGTREQFKLDNLLKRGPP
jgi:uncharacterized repeat protein (TIGR01451 family)